MENVNWRRTSSGMLEAYVTLKERPVPPKEVLEANKKKHPISAAHVRKHGFEATCALCEVTFDIPSVYESVSNTGMCSYCAVVAEGKLSSIRIKREPTLEEVMALTEDPRTLR